MSTSSKPSSTKPDERRIVNWWQEYANLFSAAVAHGFLLWGDITGYAYEAVSQRRYLQAALAQTRDVVAIYNRAQGIGFATDSMKATALSLVGMDDAPAPASDPFARALGNIGPQQTQADPFTNARNPGQALPLLEKLMRAGSGKVAVIIDYADTIVPPADKATMPPDGLTTLVTLLSWAISPEIARTNNPVFLLSTRLADIHEDIRSSGSGFKAIEIPMPDVEQRLAYLKWYQTQRKSPITYEDITIDECARLTAGLNLRHLEDILLLAARSGGVTHALVKARKDAIIASEYTEVAEMIEPLKEGFAAVGGADHLIAWARDEVIAPIKAGRAQDAPKGVLLVGPPGTGKTWFVRALAREIGFNGVALNAANILGGIVGESEKRLQQFFSFARALAPVMVFVDEIDQSDMSRRGNGSGNPVAANLFSSMLQFMSDETLRGRVIMLFATNRPDLLDPALLRFGRMDAIIPVLLPDQDARAGIIAAQARSQQIEIDVAAVTEIAGATSKYSAADLAAVVAKARKLARRNNLNSISSTQATAALAAIRPATTQQADWYSLLAVSACNDAEYLPPQYADLLANRQALQSQIKDVEPEAPRRERSL